MGSGSCATAPTRCSTPYGGNVRALTAWTGSYGALTPIRNKPSFTHPAQRREGRECVPRDYGAVRTCACQGTAQGDVQIGVTANPKCSVKAYVIQRALGPAINSEDRCAPHQHHRWGLAPMPASVSVRGRWCTDAKPEQAQTRSHPDAAEGWN